MARMHNEQWAPMTRLLVVLSLLVPFGLFTAVKDGSVGGTAGWSVASGAVWLLCLRRLNANRRRYEDWSPSDDQSDRT